MLPGDISIDDIQMSGELTALDLEDLELSMLALSTASDLNNNDFTALDFNSSSDKLSIDNLDEMVLEELSFGNAEVLASAEVATSGEVSDDVFASLDISFDSEHITADDYLGEDFADLDLNFAASEWNTDQHFENIDLNALNDTNLDQLDSLLATADSEDSSVEPSADFDNLDSLLADVAPLISKTIQDDDEFLQIEKMLQHVESKKPEHAVAIQPASRSKKQRTFEQTMRVSVKSLNNLNNLALLRIWIFFFV